MEDITLTPKDRAALAIASMVGSDEPVHRADHPTKPGFELIATRRGLVVRKKRAEYPSSDVSSVNTAEDPF